MYSSAKNAENFATGSIYQEPLVFKLANKKALEALCESINQYALMNSLCAFVVVSARTDRVFRECTEVKFQFEFGHALGRKQKIAL
jgi:hypothetical protein